MGGQMEKELAVVPGVGELISRWSSQRDAAENERPGIVGELLMP